MEAGLPVAPPQLPPAAAGDGVCSGVMRHAEPLPVGALPDSMPQAASQTRLISPSGGALHVTTVILSAGVATEAMSAVTVFADPERPPASFVAAYKNPEHAVRQGSISNHVSTLARRRSAAAGMMLTTLRSAPVQNPAVSGDWGQSGTPSPPRLGGGTAAAPPPRAF